MTPGLEALELATKEGWLVRRELNGTAQYFAGRPPRKAELGEFIAAIHRISMWVGAGHRAKNLRVTRGTKGTEIVYIHDL